MKFVRPSVFFNKAPAIGAPIKEAMLDTLHDMPNRVPKRERSGMIFANAAEGTVTRAAEKKPNIQNCQREFRERQKFDLTPENAKCYKRALLFNANPTQRQYAARKRAQRPRHNRAQKVRQHAARQPPEETPRHRQHKHI